MIALEKATVVPVGKKTYYILVDPHLGQTGVATTLTMSKNQVIRLILSQETMTCMDAIPSEIVTG
jgi:hypothetical protein